MTSSQENTGNPFGRLTEGQLNTAQLTVIEAAVAALIATHPDPAAVRQHFDRIFADLQIGRVIGTTSPQTLSELSAVAIRLRDLLFPPEA